MTRIKILLHFLKVFVLTNKILCIAKIPHAFPFQSPQSYSKVALHAQTRVSFLNIQVLNSIGSESTIEAGLVLGI